MVLSFQCSIRSLLLKWYVNFLGESVIYHEEKEKERRRVTCMIKEKRVELKCKQTKNYCDLKLKVDEKH